jgi:ribosome-binding factor A
MDARRSQRLSEALREELTEIIALEMADPRTDGVYVTEVQLSPDARLAVVRLFIPGDESRREQAVEALTGAKAFLKRELTNRVDVFRMPDLRFEADMLVTRSERLDYLFRKVRKGRPRDVESTEKIEKKP